MLEAIQHEFNSFATLTYAEENLPKNKSLNPNHTRDWIKRLRREIYPRKLRYYLVGEYGETKGRPHYHAALFGVSPLESRLVEQTWSSDNKPIGNIVLRELGPETSSYIAGYVTKKLTQKELESCGGVKEFQRMSLKPGIGALSMVGVAKAMRSIPELGNIWNGDVPNVLRHSGKLWPIGRYLKRKIREYLGREQDTPKSALEAYRIQMQELCEGYLDDAKNEEEKRFIKACGKKSIIVGLQKQKVLNFISRAKIREQSRRI